ncbi:hypothetical protein APR12_004164 [Nocardia amikacinitolerans]|uniref:hypothetical protein n=1 Tax=Nocardia amikacinitolerans TaxID=756689 RepID=UPI0012ECD6D1|nr:hypothetical protein [Nocardia amikacinitolerans]MCP2318805.1 hypothetical protein [Nocardia amikacinitolerans]
MITSPADLAHRPPIRRCEIGAFPEFYLDRLLLDHLAAARRWGVDDLPEWANCWQLDATAIRARLLTPETLPETTVVADSTQCEQILRRVRTRLAQSPTLFDDTRADRVATIRWWYTREAFRYGTQSRPDMLYPRPELDALAEALFVSLTLARKLAHYAVEAESLTLLRNLSRLRGIHEQHAADFVARGLLVGDSASYHAALTATRALFDE